MTVSGSDLPVSACATAQALSSVTLPVSRVHSTSLSRICVVTSRLYSSPVMVRVVAKRSASKYQPLLLSMSMLKSGLPSTIAQPAAPYFGSSVVPETRHIHLHP